MSARALPEIGAGWGAGAQREAPVALLVFPEALQAKTRSAGVLLGSVIGCCTPSPTPVGDQPLVPPQ